MKPSSGRGAPCETRGPLRRAVLGAAVAGAGAACFGCGSGQGAFATGGPRANDGPGFVDPVSAATYVATLRLGTQAANYLEMPDQSSGLPNAIDEADFDRIRLEGGFDHVRIPANCAARADVTGRVSEDFLLKLDRQIALALARFERVVLDPLHHYMQWKGDHYYDRFYDDQQRVAALDADQHGLRATAIWTQLANRYRTVPTRLSFDLFNEPTQFARQGDFPIGLDADQLNAWHAAVLKAIRATGGGNLDRMCWLEPWSGRLDLLVPPADAGPIGVSPHCYTPLGFTAGSDALTAAAMADYVEDIRYAKRWGEQNAVTVWIGESGVSLNLANSRTPRPAQERAEFIAMVRDTGRSEGIPICCWAYNSDFALYDQAAGTWLPSMLQAVTAQPSALPVRPLPAFAALSGGRVLLTADPENIWPGFRYEAATGLLEAAANDSGADQSLILVFPDIAVAGGQSWIVRATDFSGEWRIGNCPVIHDPDAVNLYGIPGLDQRALDPRGQSIYPHYRALAPGGFVDHYGPIGSAAPFLAVDLLFAAGSPAGHMSFACLSAP